MALAVTIRIGRVTCWGLLMREDPSAIISVDKRGMGADDRRLVYQLYQAAIRYQIKAPAWRRTSQVGAVHHYWNLYEQTIGGPAW